MRRPSQRGFSLMEITIVLAIVSGVMILTYRLIEETVTATMFNESHNDLAVMSQQAVNAVQAEVMQARLVFEENTQGIAYRTALTFPTAPGVWTTSVLPIIDASTVTLEPDTTTTRFTGNALFLVRQMPPLTLMYDHDGKANTADIEFLADRYRFDYIYLRKDTTVKFARSGQTADLMMATSEEYADYFQLSGVTAKPGNLAAKVIAAGLKQAWDPGKDVTASFYDLSGATDGTFDAAIKKPTIPIMKTKTLLKGLLGGRITGKMSYSVAFAAPSGPAYPLRVPIAQFAQPIAALPNYPSGFEVKIIGPAGNRQVLTRIVLMAQYGKTYEAQQAAVSTAARF